MALTDIEKSALFKTLLGTQEAFGAGAAAGLEEQRLLTKEEFLEQKVRADGLEPTGAIIEEGELIQRFGRVGAEAEKAITPYQQHLIEWRDWQKEWKKKQATQKIPKDISYLMQLGKRYETLGQKYEEGSSEREIYTFRTEDTYSKAAELINKRYGTALPDWLIEEVPLFELFGIPIGKKKIVRKREPARVKETPGKRIYKVDETLTIGGKKYKVTIGGTDPELEEVK